MSSKNISFKSFIDLAQAVTYLEDLASSLRDGRVYVRQADEYVELVPTDGIEIQLDASEKKGKQKLTLELTWRRSLEANGGGSNLSISSNKPEIPVAAAQSPTAGSESDDEDEDDERSA